LDSYVGSNVKIPVLLSDDKKSKIKQLELQSKKYGIRTEDKSAQLNQESLIAKLELLRIQLQLKTQEDNIILYKETLKILQDRFKEQQATSNELNRQENELQKNKGVAIWIIYLNATGQLSKLWK